MSWSIPDSIPLTGVAIVPNLEHVQYQVDDAKESQIQLKCMIQAQPMPDLVNERFTIVVTFTSSQRETVVVNDHAIIDWIVFVGRR